MLAISGHCFADDSSVRHLTKDSLAISLADSPGGASSNPADSLSKGAFYAELLSGIRFRLSGSLRAIHTEIFPQSSLGEAFVLIV